jgi:two-component system response regulator
MVAQFEAQVILLVDDDPDDVWFSKRALKAARVKNPVLHIDNGEQACDALFRRGAYAPPAAAPDVGLVLLDLQLPRVTGLEILDRLRDDPARTALKVVMLSGAQESERMEIARAHGADGYLVKPLRPELLLAAIQASGWAGLVLDAPD